MIEIDALRQTVAQAGFGALWVGLISGFLFSFSPVALAAIPVSLAYIMRSRAPRQSLLFVCLFILGLIATHVALGVAASLGGAGVQQLLGRWWGLVLGPLLIALGLIWPGWLRLRLPAMKRRFGPVAGAWGAFALGAPFSVAICPVCAPALVVLLGVAGTVGSPVFGTTLLLAFALGRAIPILLGALAFGWLENLSVLGRFQEVFVTIGGVLLILSGLYLLNAYLMFLPGLAQ